MSDELSAPPTGGPSALRAAAFAVACLGLVALVAAAFVFSYPGLHAVALQARISPRLARGYPLIFDALLVVAMPAVLTARTAGWPSRLLAWIILLALLGAAAAAGALHAAGRTLPARPAAVTAAILPWALVLIAFVLLLTMLQRPRARRRAAERAGLYVTVIDEDDDVEVPRPPQSLVPGFPDLVPPPPAQEAVVPAAPVVPDDPVDPDGEGVEDIDDADEATQENEDDPEMPVFHRVWSTPMPPEEAAQ